MTCTKQEMLALWRRHLGFEIARTDCTVEVFEGINSDDIILDAMRLWYLRLLDTADPRLLPVGDIASELSPVMSAPQTVTVALPENCRRVVEVRASDWLFSVTPLDADTPIAEVRLANMASPYAVPGKGSPLAIMRHRRLTLMPCDLSSLLTVKAVIDPGEDVYILDESLLSTIPHSIITHESK